VTCESDCQRLENENCILERRLDDQHQLIADCERREQDAIQRVRDTLQLADEAQLDKEEVCKTAGRLKMCITVHGIMRSYSSVIIFRPIV